MATENVTTKFKVDISDLKKGIADANKAIKTATAEFKNATAGMDKWADSADGLSAKIQQQTKILDAEKAKLNLLQQQLQRLTTAQEKGERIIADLTAKHEEAAAQYGENSDEAKEYAKQLLEAQKAQERNAKAADDLRLKIINQDTAVKTAAAQVSKYETALDDLQKSEQSLTEKASKQEKQLQDLKQKYIDVASAQGKNSTEAKELAREISELSGELKENRDSLDKAEEAANKLDESFEDVGNSADSTASGGLQTFAVALGNLIANVVTAAVDKLAELATETIEVGKSFEKSMSNVQAVSGATDEQLQLLTETAKEYGSTTQFSASEAADALGYMALAGWDAETSAKSLGGVLNLAAASGMDLAAASDMVTDYLSAFGMGAEESAYFADLLAYAQGNANTTAAGLGEAFKNCAAVLNAGGQDVETATALLSMMANQGLKGSEAGTALTAVMRDMTAKMKDGAIAIGDASVQVQDAQGNYRDLTDILADVEAATNGMGDAEKATAISATFTSDSIKGLNLILAAGTDEAAAFEEALRDSSGTAENMAAIMNDNLEGDLTSLGSQFEGVQIAIYEAFSPALRDGVGALSQLTGAVGDYVAAMTSGNIEGAAAAFAESVTNAISVAYDGIKDSLPMMAQEGIKLVGAIIESIVNSLPLLVDAGINIVTGLLNGLSEAVPSLILAVINIIPKIIKALTDNVPPLLNAAINFLMAIVDAIPDVIAALMDALPQIVTSIISALVAAIPQLLRGALDLLRTIVKAVPQIVPLVINAVPEIIGALISALLGGLPDILAAAVDLLTGIIDAIPQLLPAVYSEIPLLIMAIVKILIDNIPVIIDTAVQLLMGIVEAIPQIIPALVKAIPQIIDALINTVMILPDALFPYFVQAWEGIKKAFAPVGDWFKGIFSTAWENIKAVWGLVAGWFNDHVITPIKDFFTPIVDYFKNIFDIIGQLAEGCWVLIKTVWSAASGWYRAHVIEPVFKFFSGLWNGIKTTAKTAWEFIKTVWAVVSGWFNNTIIQPVAKFFGGMWDRLKTGAAQAWEGIKSVFSKVAEFFRSTFQTAWEKVKAVFSVGGKVFDGIKDGIVSAFKTVVNAIIRGINKVVKIPFEAINRTLDKIQGVDVLGVRPFSNLTSRVSVPQIPELARGGIVNRATLAQIGEDGAEAVIPLDKNKGGLKQIAQLLAGEMQSGGTFGGNGTTTGGNVYNFNQTNNSPKALSRYELYRQGQNLFNAFKMQGV